MRAYTPSEQKKIKAAADAFRPNPKFRTEEVISTLATGEALISCLDAGGRPSVVEKAWILPPQSSLGTLDELTRTGIINKSPMGAKYDTAIDRESAYEILHKRALQEQEKKQKEQENKKASQKKPGRPKTSFVEKAANSLVFNNRTGIGTDALKRYIGLIQQK